MSFTDKLVDDMFCGSIAGIGNCLSGFALDTIKTRMQLENIGAIQCFRSIVKNQGFFALFNGIYYPLVTIPIMNAVSFSSYQVYKKFDKQAGLSFWSGLEAGAFSGLIGCLVVNPVQLVKIRMQVSNRQFSNSADCLKSILKNQGIKGIYKGMFSTIARQIPSMAGQFAAYQKAKQYFLRNKQTKKLSIVEAMVTGGIAGWGAWVFAYPQDVIKTHLQVSKNPFPVHKLIPDGGFFSCGKQIYRKNGIKGFFAGIQPLFIRAFIANGFMILFYEQAQHLLKKIYTSQKQ